MRFEFRFRVRLWRCGENHTFWNDLFARRPACRRVQKSKTFDVEGLTAATSAYYGFWGLDPYDRKEFEARFDKSHADAVEFGTAFADERTGPDAIIKSGETSWEEGAKEARSCVRISSNPSCHLSKYGDYVIYGNMILICQGRDSATSLEQCAALLDEVAPTPAEG